MGGRSAVRNSVEISPRWKLRYNSQVASSVKTIWCSWGKIQFGTKKMWKKKKKKKKKFNSKPSIFTYPLTVEVVVAPRMTSQPVSFIVLCSQLPSVTWQTPGLSNPNVIFPSLLLSALSSFTFQCALQDSFGQTWWTKDSPYHCSLRLFTMVRRSSRGSIVWWIFPWTLSLVT